MPTEQCNRILAERYFLGEGGVEEKRAFRLHLDGCAACRDRLSALENQRREYLIAHPFRDFAAKHLPEGSGSPRRAAAFPRWLPAVAGLAACLVLVPLVARFGMRPHGAAVAMGERTKGGPILAYYLKRGAAVAPGDASEAVRAGDELQFVYAAGGHAYVTLASIDSRGHVSLYRWADAPAPDPGAAVGAAPAAGGSAAPLSLAAQPGEKQSLPFAVTLDDSPGSELFVMVFGPGPLDGSAVEAWLTEAYTRASGNLEGLTSLLSPPPAASLEAGGSGGGADAGTGDKDRTGSEIKTLLLRKTQA